MRAYLLSPEGVPMNPVLFPMFWKIWEDNGCSIVDRIEDCEVVFMDLHTRIAPYKHSDIYYIMNNEVDLVSFDEFDKGGMSNLDWPMPLTEQQRIVLSKYIINGVHFCRLLDKTKKYPLNVFSYEKPFLYEEPMVSEEELFNRPYDIVWIANTAPQRERLKKILEEDGRLKCKIILGEEKLPLQDWVNAHKEGKMFVKWSAGGYGCEKAQHLFSISAMIKEDNNQLLLHDWTDCLNCVKINPEPTKEDIDVLVSVVNDKEKLYDIYKNGYEFVKKYYSKEYIGKYILQKIKDNLR